MITLVSTEAIGFGSIIGPVIYKWGERPLTIITGDNGAGKTTIFNALCWCLFKQSIKKGSSIESWEHIRPKDYKGTKVETVFKVDKKVYRVIRCMGYKGKVEGLKGGDSLYIYENGALLPIKDKNQKNQKIEKLLGYSFDLFKASVLIGQRMKSLIEEDGPAKKKVFEEAFEASFISRAKETAELEMKMNIMPRFNELTTQIRVAEEKNAGLKELFAQAENSIKTFKADCDFKIRTLQDKISVLKKRKEDLPSNSKEIKKLKESAEELKFWIDAHEEQITTKLKNFGDKEFKLDMEISGLEEQAERILDRIKGLMNKKPETCPKCGFELKSVKKQKRELTEEHDKIKEKLKVLKPQYTFTIDKLKKYRDKSTLLADKKREFARQMEKIDKAEHASSIAEELDRQIQELESDIQKESTKKNPYKKQLKELEAKIYAEAIELDNLANQFTQIKKERDVLEWVIKDALSHGGLKAYIFDSMLKHLNVYLKKYTQTLGFEVRVVIDLDSANKDIHILVIKNGKGVMFSDLSGGQKQLVNVALIFAVNDAVCEAKPINLLILDEVFEGLTKKNCQVVMEMIQEKSENKNVHLITHHPDFITTNSHRIHFQQDSSGATTIRL